MAENTKVFFKRGQQSSIESLKRNTSQIIDGSFYLTEDTHRLYVGQGSSLVLLNQTVQFIDSLSDLYSISGRWSEAEKAAHVNDIYYVKPNIAGDTTPGNTAPYGNILAVWTATGANAYAWTQINPNTDTKVEAFTSTVSASGNVATINNAVTSGGQGFEDSFKLSAGTNNNIATVNIVSANGDEVIVTGDTYSLTVDASDNKASFTLSSALGQESSVVKIVAGDNVSIIKNANDEIVVSSQKWVPTIAGGSSVELQEDGTLLIELSDGQTHLEMESDVLGYKLGSNNTIVPLGSSLDVYTRDEITTLLNDLNGMTYKGTISDINKTYSTVYKIKSDGSLERDGVVVPLHSGDMFLVTGDNITVNGSEIARPGDLVIASGKEENGIITDDLNWAIIESGDTVVSDTTYVFKASGPENTFTVTSQKDGVGTYAGSITLQQASSENPVIISSEIDDNEKTLVTTIAHAVINPSRPEPDSIAEESFNFSDSKHSITVIKDIIADNYGHVTSITPKTFILPKYAFGTLAASSGSITNSNTQFSDITSTLTLDGVESSTAKIRITSDSLQISTSKDANNNPIVNVDLEWGTF